MSLGENIRRRRLQMKMSQQELADALGYKNRSSVTKIEKNECDISHSKLESVANILNTSVQELLSGQFDSEFTHSGRLLTESDLTLPEKTKNRKCSAVILAGGSKRKNKYDIPFQFVTVKDKPVIIYTLEAFQRHPLIDEIYVVCLKGWEDFLPPYTSKYGITKLKQIIPSGDSGIKSVRNAVEWLTPKSKPFDIILIHEATRPFIDPETISNTILCCRQYGSAVTYERMDQMTTFLEDESGTKLSYLPSSRLINIQSPEAYTFGNLKQSFFDADKTQHELNETICAVFMYKMNRELKFCEGSPNNRRIVSEENLKLLEELL